MKQIILFLIFSGLCFTLALGVEVRQREKPQTSQQNTKQKADTSKKSQSKTSPVPDSKQTTKGDEEKPEITGRIEGGLKISGSSTMYMCEDGTTKSVLSEIEFSLGKMIYTYKGNTYTLEKTANPVQSREFNISGHEYLLPIARLRGSLPLYSNWKITCGPCYQFVPKIKSATRARLKRLDGKVTLYTGVIEFLVVNEDDCDTGTGIPLLPLIKNPGAIITK
jgi:hypothetical protein